MPSDHLLVEVKNRVGILTLNRPDKLNAFTGEMSAAAAEALKDFGQSAEVGAIVITGAGKGFCAGGDVSAMNEGFSEEAPSLERDIDRLRQGQEVSWLLHHMPKPTIALVNGAAAGAGLGIALSCDLRFASDKAKFTTAYANVGFGGDYGITWQLTRLVGPAKAKELFFLPDVFGPEEAARLGLVNRVLPHDQLMAEGMALAERIGAGPAVSYRYMKANVNFSLTSDFRTMLEREAETHLRCGMTEDHREGVRAFLEKRKPNFKGR